jgi:PAS domain S-box-containing protein
LGYQPGEYLGRSLFQLIHPDDLERVREQFARLVESPQLHPREQFRLLGSDGDWRWVEAVGSNLLADASVRGVVINYHDITERKRAEDEIQKVREFNQTLLDNMSEGIAVQNMDGYFIYANPATTRITGYSSGELLGAHWTKFFPENQHEIIRKADELRAAGRASQYELEFLHKNGGRIKLLVSGSPLFENGRVNGSMAVFTDITERKQAEEKLQTQFEELQRWYNATVGREERILQLKREINELLRKLNEPIRYPSAE